MQRANCFTCRDMLLLSSMAGSVLLAGEQSLDSRITRVNTVEVPDIINWVGEREMLITTGYPFKDDKERIAQMIPLLVEKKVVGMAIKPKRYIDEIPESVIETAQKYNFIVISLSTDAVFSSIVRESLEQILAREMVLMTETQKISEEVIAAAAESTAGMRLESALECFSDRLSVISFIRSDSEIIKPNGREIPESLKEIPLSAKTRTVQESSGVFYRCMVQHLGAQGNGWFVCAVKNGDFSELAVAAAERVTGVLSLEYDQRVALIGIRNQYKSRFISEWISGAFHDENDLAVCAEAYGCTISAETLYRTVVAAKAEISCAVMECIGRVLLRMKRRYYTTFCDGRLAVVMESLIPDACEDAAELSEAIERALPPQGLSLCLSERTDAAGVPKQYERVKRICAISERCRINRKLITHSDLGVYEVLSLIPHDSAVDEFVEHSIAPLAEYDAVHGSDFLGTLRCYYECGSNIKATADSLFTHYNTICYRLDRIRRILGVEIDDADTSFRLQTALILYRINGMDEKEEKQ